LLILLTVQYAHLYQEAYVIVCVCLSVCLFSDRAQDKAKSFQVIFMKLCRSTIMWNSLNCGLIVILKNGRMTVCILHMIHINDMQCAGAI